MEAHIKKFNTTNHEEREKLILFIHPNKYLDTKKTDKPMNNKATKMDK